MIRDPSASWVASRVSFFAWNWELNIEYIVFTCWVDWITFLFFLFLIVAPLIFPSHVIIFWIDEAFVTGPLFPPCLIFIVVTFCIDSSSDESLLETKVFSRLVFGHNYIFLLLRFAFHDGGNCQLLWWSFAALLITCCDAHFIFRLLGGGTN